MTQKYAEALRSLMRGGVGVIPTDTVYGLVARAHDEAAAARLYSLKNRERKPGTVIAANVEQLSALGIDQQQLDAASGWWPGPLSAVLELSGPFAYLHQGLGDIAVRVVKDPELQDLLMQTGPLLTTSANQPGEPGATNIQEAQAYFGTSVDFYVDGGDLSGRAPSTIIRFSKRGDIEVLRAGAVDVKIQKTYT